MISSLIPLPTLTSVASDQHNHALKELSAWAAACASRSVTEVTTNASTGATHSLIKMASFQVAYFKYSFIDSAEFFIWYSETCFSFCPRLVVPTVYPKAPRLLPACALSHGARALNCPDLGHATKEHRDTPSAYPDSRSADETCPAHL